MLRKPSLLSQHSLGQSCYADVLRSMVMKIGSSFDQSPAAVAAWAHMVPVLCVNHFSDTDKYIFYISWINAADSSSTMCSSKNKITHCEFIFHHCEMNNEWSIFNVTISILRVPHRKSVRMRGELFFESKHRMGIFGWLLPSLSSFWLPSGKKNLTILVQCFTFLCDGSIFKSSTFLKESSFRILLLCSEAFSSPFRQLPFHLMWSESMPLLHLPSNFVFNLFKKKKLYHNQNF